MVGHLKQKQNSQQLTFFKKAAVALFQKVSCCFFAKSRHLHAGIFCFLLFAAVWGLSFVPTASAGYLPVIGSNIGIGTLTPVGGLVVLNGNVGVGTWSPTAGLEVKSGAAKVWTGAGTNTNAASNGELYVEGDLEVDGSIYGDGSGLTNITVANGTNGWTDGGTNVFVATTTDNVGIGTTTPTATALVENVSAIDSFRVNDSLLDTTPFVIGPGGNIGIGTTTAGSLLSVSGGAAIGNTQAYKTLAAPTNGLIVEGNVGIGTTAAANALTVSGAQTIGSGFVANAAPTGGLLVQGNVGIGTTKPVGGLSVLNGNVGIGTFSPSALFEISSADDQDLFKINDNGPGDGSPFVIDKDGNVGMGSASPGFSKLIVNGDIAVIGADVIFDDDGTTNLSYIHFDDTNSVVSGSAKGIYSFHADDSAFVDFFSPTASIAADGAYFRTNVGVGTSEPNAFLDISTTTAQDLFLVNDNGTGDTTPFVINSVGNVGIGTSLPEFAFVMDALANGSGNRFVVTPAQTNIGNRQIKFFTQGGSAANGGWSLQTIATSSGVSGTGANITIGFQTKNGLVGIGTFTSNALLEIASTAAQPLFMVSDNGSGDSTPFVIDSNGNVGIGTSSANGILIIPTGNVGFGTLSPVAGLTVMTGNVGIGTWSPISRLEVKSPGSAQVTINGPSGGCLMMRDTDNAGWTECNALNGVITCSIDADAICDGV